MASEAQPNDYTTPTARKDQEAAPPAPILLAPAPEAPSAAGSTIKASTLTKMGFAHVMPVTDRAAPTIAPPPSPITTTVAAPPAGAQQQQQQQLDRTQMLMNHKSSSLAFLQAAKQRRKPCYRPTLVRVTRLAQLLLVLRWTIPVLLQYRRGQGICPYAVVCSNGYVEIALLCLSKVCGLLMYPLLALVFLSKCASVRTFFQHTYIAEMMNLYGLHELHVQFGYELAVLTALHVAGHIARYALHDPRLLAAPASMGRNVTLSGYVAAVLLALVVASLGWGWLKRRVCYEPRKLVHMLSVPMLVALCFHHQRLLATCAFLLVTYALDWAYNNLFKTHRVEDPRLFPIGDNGTLVEFRLPKGFHSRSGEYVFVCVPHLSKYEWHAFSTIPITYVDGSLGCSFYAQACGDWTAGLLATARRSVRRPLWVNGPYPSPFDTSVKFDYLFIICTGIGITPGISVVSQYCGRKQIVLVWVCRSQELIDLYRSELQVVQSKVFHTGNGGRPGSSNQQEQSRVEGSVVYASGRPDLCAEIKNVILHHRPLDPRLAAQIEAAQREAAPALPFFATTPGAAGGGAEAGQQGRNSPKTPRRSLRRTMVPSPYPEHALESGGLASPAPPSPGSPRRSLIGEAGVGAQQPYRQALTHLYEVDREEEVDPSEWLVLYCGASTSLGDTLKKYCHARGIKYKTEFFGSW